MTDEQPTWDGFYKSLNVGIVNVYELTEHLDTLYTKISELEARLDKEEEYRQEQND